MKQISRILSSYSLFHPYFKLCHLFSYNNQTNSTLRQYFNNRMQYSNVDLIRILESVRKSQTPTYSVSKDHRFVHLITKISNHIEEFGLLEKLQIAKNLSRLHYRDELYQNVTQQLIKSAHLLMVNELALLLSILKQNKGRDIDSIKKICDLLLNKLSQKKSLKITINNQNMPLNELNNFNLQDEEDKEIQEGQTVQLKSLLVILWSLDKLKITDKDLVQCIVKNYLKPNLQVIPVKLMPMMLMTLTKQRMSSKRIFRQVVDLICKPENKSQLEKLNQNLLRDLICQVSKVPEKKMFVLWLLQNLLLKQKEGPHKLTSIDFYKIFINLAKNQIEDREFNKIIIKGILNDLESFQGAQIIGLVEKLVKMNKQAYQNQIEQVCAYIWGKFHFFLSNYDEQHLARQSLRKMVVEKQIKAPQGVKKLLTKEHKEIKRRKQRPNQKENRKQQTLEKEQLQLNTNGDPKK